jgi:hypothetical protein
MLSSQHGQTVLHGTRQYPTAYPWREGICMSDRGHEHLDTDKEILQVGEFRKYAHK